VIDRMQLGEVPPKHHVASRGPDGRLRWEECLTRQGFDGPYTILYHQDRPHEQLAADLHHGWTTPGAAPPAPPGLRKRHFRTPELAVRGLPPVDARMPLLWNDDVVVSLVTPVGEDPVYFSNGDGDDLYFIAEGGGLLRSVLGDVRFGPEDYLYVPKGLVHRFLPDPGAQRWLSIEALGGLGFPRQFRNEVGQLRMDAPLNHRDFRRPGFRGPIDEGIRELLVKRGGAFHGFRQGTSPLDVTGWDGAVWPFAVPILAFQPRVGQVHLPPTVHGTFAARGALVCSFVPRPLDFHPDAVPCPYPHSSVDVDEVIFYQRGEFTSRNGVGPGSISLHPAGVPHGPHPGASEKSLGARATDEVAVMLDCFGALRATEAARGIEDAGYEGSFSG
jgi:homogentisate 1,2-dioxygenase